MTRFEEVCAELEWAMCTRDSLPDDLRSGGGARDDRRRGWKLQPYAGPVRPADSKR